MDDSNVLNDVRFLRDVVSKTQPAPNYRWPITLAWGCVVVIGYAICAYLGLTQRTTLIPWVMPVLVFGVGWPLQWYLIRRVKTRMEQRGVRPRFSREAGLCWAGIVGIGLLWTAALVVSGLIAEHWYLVVFVWASLQFVGYVMNGALLSAEWFWAAGVMFISLIVAVVAGPVMYWLPGFWIGGTLVLAGLLGRRSARRQVLPA
jgi:hypothetical protein